MDCQTHIVVALYREKLPMDFDDIVDEFDLSLRGANAGRRRLTYDYDDLVIIDSAPLRVGLAWVHPDAPDQPFALVIATGSLAEALGDDPDRADADAALPAGFAAALGETALARLGMELPFDAALRATLNETLDSDLLDRVASGLDRLMPQAQMQAPEPAPEIDTRCETEPAPGRLLDDIATPLYRASPVPMTASPDGERTAPAIDAAQSALDRLRAAYASGSSRHSARILDALEAITRRVAQRLAPDPGLDPDPYVRLAPREKADRYFQRFDQAEYELYGHLLD